MKPGTFALLVLSAGVVMWLYLSHHTVSISIPTPAPVPALTQDRAETLLCDKEVDALLHSKDPIEIARAGIIIQSVNCGIGKRL
jgi:hypothetical protein